MRIYKITRAEDLEIFITTDLLVINVLTLNNAALNLENRNIELSFNKVR